MKGIELSYVVLKLKKRVKRTGIESDPNFLDWYATPNVVSGYGPYLKSQRSKNYKISIARKKIRFSTISPEIKIFEFTPFLPQIWHAISG